MSEIDTTALTPEQRSEIPPPSEADLKINMVTLYDDVQAVGRGLTKDGTLLVIRRCHAAEQRITALTAERDAAIRATLEDGSAS